MSDNTLYRTFGYSALLTIALALKYPDRAIFDENPKGVACKKGWPLIGLLPAAIKNRQSIHELFMNGFNELDSMTS